MQNLLVNMILMMSDKFDPLLFAISLKSPTNLVLRFNVSAR